MDKKTLSRFLIPVIVGALIWFSPIPNGVSPDAWHILAMMTAIIVGFIAVPVNIGCVAFIGLMAVMLTGTLSPGAALKGFSNTLLWLIVTAFLFSRAFVKTGLGERISLWILSKIGDSSLKVAYGLTISGSLLAAGIPSGTARAGGVIYPILRSICSALGSEPDKNPDKIGRFLIQSYFQSEAFISYLFLTAMAGNVLVMQFAQDLAKGGWAVGAFLPAIVSIILVPYCTYLLVPPQLKKAPEAKAAAQRMYAALGPVKPQEKLLFGIFCFSIIMWMLGDFTGIGSTLVALIAVSAMLLMGILTWEDVLGESGAWNTLMWMGVLVCLASALTEKGFMVWLGNSMGAMFTGMNWMLVTFLVCLFFNYIRLFNGAHGCTLRRLSCDSSRCRLPADGCHSVTCLHRKHPGLSDSVHRWFLSDFLRCRILQYDAMVENRLHHVMASFRHCHRRRSDLVESGRLLVIHRNLSD